LDIPTMYEQYVMNTYRRDPQKTLVIKEGRGARVRDERGGEYLDFVGGLAVNALGHSHPRVVEAIRHQAEALIHTSNLYYTEPQAKLACRLSENSLGGKVFFANSGAEANETAIKAARKYAKNNISANRHTFVTALGSFHGRTLATVTATGQEHHQKDFDPLPAGFIYAPFNDADAFERAVNEETCAVMVEPVQGESGVHVAEKDFLRALRRICDENGLLLIFDEVQCGVGRTGTLWAYQDYGVEPDIITSAKALGGGMPLAAAIFNPKISSALGPGDHASTFGGNPVSCSAALAVMEVLLDDGLLQEVNAKSEFILGEIKRIREQLPGVVKGVRGKGLILAMELDGLNAAAVQAGCQSKGLLVNAIRESTVRILPPFIIDEQDVQQFASIFMETLQEITGS